jgi:hypothetical protein
MLAHIITLRKHSEDLPSNSAPKGFRLLRTLEVRSQVEAGGTRRFRLPVSESQWSSFSGAPPSRESGFGLVGLTRAGPRPQVQAGQKPFQKPQSGRQLSLPRRQQLPSQDERDRPTDPDQGHRLVVILLDDPLSPLHILQRFLPPQRPCQSRESALDRQGRRVLGNALSPKSGSRPFSLKRR